jgi:hypothetical protein
MGGSALKSIYSFYSGVNSMATTGELRAIMQELHLVDVGNAESYLGEEAIMEEELAESVLSVLMEPVFVLVTDDDHLATCDCNACQLVHA